MIAMSLTYPFGGIALIFGEILFILVVVVITTYKWYELQKCLLEELSSIEMR